MKKKNANAQTSESKKNIMRYSAETDKGLTSEQVAERINDGLNNQTQELPTKSVKRILYDNIFTLFNVLNLVLGLLVFYVGSYKNMLFLGVMLCNTAIGIFQEIRAKKTIDRLSIVSATKVNVVRDGKIVQVHTDEIVLDDIIEFSQGNQIPVDCKVISGECDVNESLLTGESDAVHKTNGDMMFSGSFIVSGKCFARVEHIGDENYASKISAEAKYIKKVNSEIMFTLKKIIKILTIIIIPLAVLLLLRQYGASEVPDSKTITTIFGAVNARFADAMVSTVASVIGMIPEGLILLTSTVLAVSVIRLSKQKVLVQELYCIETLARVDVLCLDKTGTITEGCMEVVDTVPYDKNIEKENIYDIMCGITSVMDDTNATFMALKEKFNSKSPMRADKIVPFASEKKWSGVHFTEEGTYIMGAAEFILKTVPNDLKQLLESYSRNYRAIILAHSENNFNDRDLPDDIKVLGIILLNDKIRAEAPQTLRYFADQNVTVKIISGDNPITVSDVARRANVKNYDKYVDATTLKTDEDIKEAMNKYTVFGRVTPEQKKKFVVALKEQGHTVAMTGDGVNDVLALKEADCSIAMAAGSDAARSVSQLVLLDSNFASMPKVVAEGRRSINNIQRSSTLFIVKTIFSTLLAFLFIFVSVPYPFQPIQLTLVNAFTIGIPSFILALEPNKERIKGVFFFNIMKNAVPAGLTTVINVILSIIAKFAFCLTEEEYSTLAVCLTAATAMMILFQISIPFNAIRTALYITMTAGLTIGILCFREFFGFAFISLKLLLIFAVMLVIAIAIFVLLTLPMKKMAKMVEEKFSDKTFRPDDA
ncbi:MAG: HAD-IC family P-type ATPase [Acutalibacteraceae bacterium]